MSNTPNTIQNREKEDVNQWILQNRNKLLAEIVETLEKATKHNPSETMCTLNYAAAKLLALSLALINNDIDIVLQLLKEYDELKKEAEIVCP